MKRLVDIGDVTAVLEEDGMEGLLSVVIEEDEDEIREEERNAIVLNNHGVGSTHEEVLDPMSPDDAQTPMQRAPFMDITPEATPIVRKKTYRRDDIPSVTISVTQTSPRTTRAPPGSHLASIINAINFSGSNTNTNARGREDEEEHGQPAGVTKPLLLCDRIGHRRSPSIEKSSGIVDLILTIRS